MRSAPLRLKTNCFAVLDVDLSPPAVELDLVNPIVADGRSSRQRGCHGPDERVFTQQHELKAGARSIAERIAKEYQPAERTPLADDPTNWETAWKQAYAEDPTSAKVALLAAVAAQPAVKVSESAQSHPSPATIANLIIAIGSVFVVSSSYALDAPNAGCHLARQRSLQFYRTVATAEQMSPREDRTLAPPKVQYSVGKRPET